MIRTASTPLPVAVDLSNPRGRVGACGKRDASFARVHERIIAEQEILSQEFVGGHSESVVV